MGPIPFGIIFISWSYRKLKNLLSGSHFGGREVVSGSQLQWEEFLYVGPMENYKNLLSGSIPKTCGCKWVPIAAELQWVNFTNEYHGEKWVPFQ